MSETEKLIELLQQQIENQRLQWEEQQQQMDAQMESYCKLLERFIKAPCDLMSVSSLTTATDPTFSPFNALSVLWKDYWARFVTFAMANSILEAKLPQVVLTNQTIEVYKMLPTSSCNRRRRRTLMKFQWMTSPTS